MVGSTDDFLNLSAEESEYIQLKLKLSQALKNKRQQKGLTQVEAARVLRSSQSRIAKMETGDPSVSIDLLVPGYAIELRFLLRLLLAVTKF